MPSYDGAVPSGDGSIVSNSSRTSGRPREPPRHVDDSPAFNPPLYRQPTVPQQTATQQANRISKPAQSKQATPRDEKPKRDRRDLVIKWKGHEETVLRAIAADEMIVQVLLRGRAGPFTKVQATEKLVELVADKIDFVRELLDKGKLDQTIKGTTKAKPAMHVLRDSLKGFIERYIGRYRKCHDKISQTFLSITDDDAFDENLDDPGSRAKFCAIIKDCPGYLVALKVFEDTSASFPCDAVSNSGMASPRAGVVGRIPGRARAILPEWDNWDTRDRGTPFEIDGQGPSEWSSGGGWEDTAEDRTASGSDNDDTATSDREGDTASQATPRLPEVRALRRSPSMGSVGSQSGTPRARTPGSPATSKRPLPSGLTPSSASGLRPRKAHLHMTDLTRDANYDLAVAKLVAAKFQAKEETRRITRIEVEKTKREVARERNRTARMKERTAQVKWAARLAEAGIRGQEFLAVFDAGVLPKLPPPPR
ncbi:hypothetical protein JCM1841_001718 [Sporobolomyces salmonicolor]